MISGDRFQFEPKPHGAGGFGTVIKGRDTVLERDIAVKFLNSLATEFSPEEQERFRREARILAALSHPNIPSIYDVEFGLDRFLIIFEFVEGNNLKQLLEKEGPCRLVDVKIWFTQIAGALEHAHSRDVVHRDVKPANIIISQNGQSAYLVDFGIALSKNEAEKITESGYVIGTPGYMSPEQQGDEEVDYRSDIYSLGVTLYNVLAGRRPSIGEYEELAATNEAIPPEIDKLILKCLQPRDNRLSSIKSFVADLEGALRPSKPLSDVLAYGRLHELAAAIEHYTPRDLARLPEGQRALIVAKIADIVESGDPKLQYASEQFLNLLLYRGLSLEKEEYRDIVVPSIHWAFEKVFGGHIGRNSLRNALEEAAHSAEGDAHEVLKTEFGKLLTKVNLEDQEIWYLHAVRNVIEALLANPACASGTGELVEALRKVNEIQRSRPSGSLLALPLE